MKCNIPLEPGEDELFSSTVRLCTGISSLELQEIFQSLHFHDEMWNLSVADEIATYYNDFSSFRDLSSVFQNDLMVFICSWSSYCFW